MGNVFSFIYLSPIELRLQQYNRVTPMSPEEQLVDFIADTEYSEIPKDTRDYTKLLAMKTAAGTLAGTEQPAGRRMVNYIMNGEGDSENAGILGCGFRSSVSDAVLANGTFCHASELEDDKIYPNEGVSWNITTFPLTFSLAEQYRLSGKEFIEASAISLEVHSRLQLPPTRGNKVDLILQASSAAAAAAAARSMRLDKEQIRHALGIAWAGGFVFMQHTGTDAHYLDSAFQCLRGFKAAELAKEGFDGGPDIQAMFDALYDGDSIEAEEVVDSLGDDWLFNGIGIKKYPCCFYTHRYIDALRDIKSEHDVNEQNVRSVEIDVGPIEDSYVNRPDPKTPEDAKFSLQHLLGAVLIDGDIHYEQVTKQSIKDPNYSNARSKVDVNVREDWDNLPMVGPAMVQVEDIDGNVYNRERKNMIGSKEDPLSEDEHVQLYKKFTEGILNEDDINQTANYFLSLEDKQDLQPLIHKLTYRHTK